jgi:hypothetical protein
MLKSLISFFTSIFERDPNAERIPEHKDTVSLVTVQVLGMTITGSVYEQR